MVLLNLQNVFEMIIQGFVLSATCGYIGLTALCRVQRVGHSASVFTTSVYDLDQALKL